MQIPKVSGLALCLVLPLGIMGCQWVRPKTSAPRPNVIFILVDTLRADYLGSYGFSGPISPRLDQFAHESVLFENCFSQAPWTKPSMASTFTSLYPQVHGLTNHEGRFWSGPSRDLQTGILPDDALTLAEGLRDQGYRTAAYVSNPWMLSQYGFAQGFGVYDDHAASEKTKADAVIGPATIWLESLTSDALIESSLQLKERPFFLYLHFMDVHGPYVGSKSDYDALVGSPSLQPDQHLSDRPRITWWADWATETMLDTSTYFRARYASGIRGFDAQISSFLEFLRDSGFLDNTIVVVTADHGEELHEHGGWGHGETLFDHQLRVPLLIRMPGGAAGGKRVGEIVELVDLMPTLLSQAGAKLMPTLQGRDISPLLIGASTSTQDGGSRVSIATATQQTPGLYSLRTKRYKIVLDVDSGVSRLFDFASDQGEQRDISESEPRVAARLRDHLTSAIADSLAGGVLGSEFADVPDDVLERLKALGYVD